MATADPVNPMSTLFAARESADDERPMPFGKSASLAWLSEQLSCAVVPPGHSIRARAWHAQPTAELAALADRLPRGPYAVRSDAKAEDSRHASHAGRFLSLLDIDGAQLPLAIARVLASLPGHSDDAVLVQPMVGACRRVGVASTHRIDNGAPWFCIEASTGDTAAVTSGRATGRLLAWSRHALAGGIPVETPADEHAVLTALLEIECLLPGQPFEIEWALPADDRPLQLLQWRPLASQRHWPSSEPLPAVIPASRRLTGGEPGLLGDRTVLSSMADWNPAELIGRHPRPLTPGLFRDCIGRGTWWSARSDLGYRMAPRARIDLLTSVAGRPLVDVRRSANSLLPADLPDALGARLVDCWIERLSAQPALHDKVEFSVFCTARDLRSPQAWSAEFLPLLGDAGCQTFAASASAITGRMMTTDLLALAPTLCGIASGALSLPLPATAPLRMLTRRAAREFARLARVAFVAEAQLRSAVARGVFDRERADQLRRGALAPHALTTTGGYRWAHRPSSFDITQPLWHGCTRPSPSSDDAPPRLTPSETRAIRQLLREACLPADALAWARWVGGATQSRESGKTLFSQPLAEWMERIAADGEQRGVDRETLSWLSLAQCQALVAGRLSVTGVRRLADRARAQARAEQRQLVGPMLRNLADLSRFDSLASQPNFIGRHAVRAPLQVLRDGNPKQTIVPGALIAIEHADPGFDWLFDHPIGGLLTAWGGAHSHMGIRCAEHGIAAALGCGEAVWARLQTAREAHLDPIAEALWLS